MNRQQHPDDAKAQAKALYEAHGSRKAAEATNISRRTINAWARADGWQPPGSRPDLRVAPVPETRQPAGKTRVVTSIGYSYQRRALLRRLGELATLALDQAESELRAGHTVKARDGMVCAGIALDKAEQLSKAAGPDLAGDRPDDAEALGRLQEMAGELAARRTGSDGHP
jgi:hypothetical protein